MMNTPEIIRALPNLTSLEDRCRRKFRLMVIAARSGTAKDYGDALLAWTEAHSATVDLAKRIAACKPRLWRFVLAGMSTNRNSFGLRGAILASEDGEVWEVGVNDHNLPQRGTVYQMGPSTPGGDVPYFGSFGWEVPRLLPAWPASLAALAWAGVKE